MTHETTAARPVPYPAKTKAKGWRFELDYEAIEQSDTWALAAEVPLAQHALLMMWMVAWTQQPCGSMPSDESIIRAKCRIPPDQWAQMRHVLMRGWWLAEDGRLYHGTIVQRVLEMLEHRDGERQRKADYRQRKQEERAAAAPPSPPATAPAPHPAPPPNVPDLSHGTTDGHLMDSGGKDDTGTGTGTIYTKENTRENARAPADGGPEARATQAGLICRAMKRKGIADVNPSNQKLLALIEAGATLPEFESASEKAVDTQAGFAYALGVVIRERQQAAKLAGGVVRGPPPTRETARDRAARERMAELSPRIARAAPGTPDVIDLEASDVPLIAGG